jgi:hypothetical protein
MKINLIGGGFTHAHSSTYWKKSKNIEWIKNNSENISMYVDYSIIDGLKDNSNKIKFAWWNESPYVVDIKSFMISNYVEICKKYELIFTYDTQLIKLNPNKFKFIHPNGIWIDDIGLKSKNKLISMISSNKNITKGHKKRLEIVEKYKNNVDLFGSGFNEIKKKEEGLNNYMFSIVVENGVFDDYFSEKILDCFATGTIPIYLGTKNIDKYFNSDGIIKLNDEFKIESINEELYNSKIEIVKENYNKVLEYEIPEDLLLKNYLNKYD